MVGYFKKKPYAKLTGNNIFANWLSSSHWETNRTFLQLPTGTSFNTANLATQPHLQKKLNDRNSFLPPGKITKQRIAKSISTNAFCKYNCFGQKNQTVNQHLVYRPTVYTSRLKRFPAVLSMADLFLLALTVFTFQNNTKIAINMHLLEIFALLLVFSYQFTAKCLTLPPPLLGGVISKPLTLPFALAFRTSIIETVIDAFGHS